MTVGIIGLGYVGLPMAVAFAKKTSVIGIDIDQQKVDALNHGKNYLQDAPYLDKDIPKLVSEGKLKATTNISAVAREITAYIICVPTPVDEKKRPDLKPIISVGKMLAPILKKGDLVSLESTTYPGTTKEVLLPILESSGLRVGQDFYLAYSPERIDPGSKWKVEDIPKVVGGITPECGRKAAQLYQTVIKHVVEVSNEKAAEATKILENAFRAVNIAFINEFAQYCHKEGLDVKEIIEAAKTKPYGFMPFYPSIGVGGHCIPVDPWYLIERGRSLGFYFDLLTRSMRINDDMPYFTLNLLRDALDTFEKPLSTSKITILGLSYKKNTADYRESPSLKIYELLKSRAKHVDFYDPYIEQITLHNGEVLHSKESAYSAATESDALIIGTDHQEFLNLDFQKIHDLMRTKIIVDGKNCLNREKLTKMGFYYNGIGRP